MRIAIVGCGKIGEAILGGLLDSGTIEKTDVIATTRRSEHAAEIADRHGIRATTDNIQALDGVDIALVAVKPQRALELLPTLAGALAGKLVVSMCAGIHTSVLFGKRMFGGMTPITVPTRLLTLIESPRTPGSPP